MDNNTFTPPPQTINGETLQNTGTLPPVEVHAEETPKSKFNEIIEFIQQNILTERIRNISIFTLGALMTLVCAIQLLVWFFKLLGSVNTYIDKILDGGYINAFELIVVGSFIGAMASALVKTVIKIFKTKGEIDFRPVTTLYAFYVVGCFMLSMFPKFTSSLMENVLIFNFNISGVMILVIVLLVLYCLIRFVNTDFIQRLWPVVFSGATLILVIFAGIKDLGDFLNVSIDAVPAKSIGHFNLGNYFMVLIDELSGIGLPNSEYIYSDEIALLDSVNSVCIKNPDLNWIVILLQLISITIANMLSFAIMSLGGYLIYVFVGKNHEQYYNLKLCQTVAIYTTVVSVIALVSSIILSVIYNTSGRGVVSLSVNYGNFVLTLIVCIAICVLTSMPWKLYKMAYKRKFEAYKNSEVRR